MNRLIAMLEIKQIESLEQLSQLKAQYFALSTTALDSMWHFGFVPMANHFGFYEQSLLVGYCCINSDGYMLQFYLSPKAEAQAKELFTLIAQDNSPVIGTIKGAFVSTAEPAYLSLCLDNSTAFEVNALMYQLSTAVVSSIMKDSASSITMTLAEQSQLSDFVEFAVASFGAPEQWLNGYYSNLIQRQELLGYWQDGKLLASGECRLFDEHQAEYADLGLIVAESERGKGIATQVLLNLIDRASHKGLTAMCSTESSNLGAQKAINRAGMISSHRIVQFEFV
jgi:RimJ/RimL family protein N-acetyltransferase